MKIHSDRMRSGIRLAECALGILVGASGPAFGGQATVKVEERPEEIAVDNGAIRFTVDRTATGFLKELSVGQKTVVRAAGESGVFLEAVSLAAYDGRTIDPERQKVLKATSRLRGVQVERQGAGASVVSSGELVIEGLAPVGWILRMQARPGEPLVQMTLRLETPGNPGTAAGHGTDRGRAWGVPWPDGWKDTYVRAAGVRIPLALGYRKRVVQGGDRGLRFDSRYTYDFDMYEDAPVGGIWYFTIVDHSEWNLFGILQDAPNHFRAWKAESARTASLTQAHGRQAAGWIAMYDPECGAAVGYRGISANAPKALLGVPTGAGALIVYLHPPYCRPLDLRPGADPQKVFGMEHTITLAAHEGEFAKARPDQVIARNWGVDRFESDDPVRTYPPAPGPIEPAFSEGEAGLLVNGGVPLPRGAITSAENVVLRREGKEVPLQAKALAFWPDKSIKWVLLTFPLDGCGGYEVTAAAGGNAAATIPIHVTTRRNETLPFELAYGPDVRRGKLTSPLRVAREADRVTVDTGRLSWTVATGKGGFLTSATLDGQPIVREGGARRNFLDYLSATNDYATCTSGAVGKLEPSDAVIDKIEVEEEGPLRAVVKLTGKFPCQDEAGHTLRIEAYAGRTYLRVFHSVTFMQKDIYERMVRGMGLRLPLALGDSVSAYAGGEGEPVRLEGARAGLAHPSYLHYEAWQAEKPGGPAATVGRGEKSAGWLDVSDGRRGCTVVDRFMWQEFPKEISCDLTGKELTAWLWPESENLMDVRRYSEYPHEAQGESTGGCTFKQWKPMLPEIFIGVSKTHELLFYFHNGDWKAAQSDRLAADFERPALVYVTPEWYRQTEIAGFYQVPDTQRFPMLERNLQAVTDFYLFNQGYWGWYGMWDFGDFQHDFHAGYGWISPKAKPGEKPGTGILDYFPQYGWCYDNGRWGWNDTEGLEGLWLEMQYLRTGRRDYYFAAEATARHSRDVNARQAGKAFGTGTRHGVQHWSDGDFEERVTVNSEFRFVYYLSGDGRSRDVNELLTEGKYLKGRQSVSAQHSARLQGILMRWEITGDDRYGKILHDYARCFCVPEGFACSPPVQFPEATLYGKPEEVNSKDIFFHSFGGGHAIVDYCNLTHDEVVGEALRKLATAFLDWPPDWADVTLAHVMAFSARTSRDPAPFKKWIEEHITAEAKYHSWYDMVPSNPAFWIGPKAYLTDGKVDVAHMHQHAALYELAVLDHEPALTEAQKKDIALRQTKGWPEVRRRESWQEDRPPLKPE